jgi:imidazolonepropionase-like amidohydrolase
MHEKVKHYHEESGELAALIQKYKPKIVFNTDAVFLTLPERRAHRDFEKFVFSNWFGNHALLRALTSTPGEMTKLTGRRNPYPEGKLGVIEEGAYADILLVDGNPLEDISVIGVNSVWIGAKPREEGVETIRVIMKDGVIYKNSL